MDSDVPLLRAWNAEDKEMVYIHDLYWFEEQGVHDFHGQGHNTKYEIMLPVPECQIGGQQVYVDDILFTHSHLKTCVLPVLSIGKTENCDDQGDSYVLVSYMQGGFFPLAWAGGEDNPDLDDYVIVGNRHQNPELLSF